MHIDGDVYDSIYMNITCLSRSNCCFLSFGRADQ